LIRKPGVVLVDGRQLLGDRFAEQPDAPVAHGPVASVGDSGLLAALDNRGGSVRSPPRPTAQGTADLFAVPAAHRGAAIFNGNQPLKMKESGNRAFAFRLIFGQDGQ
jgi:hypothetical protein